MVDALLAAAKRGDSMGLAAVLDNGASINCTRAVSVERGCWRPRCIPGCPNCKMREKAQPAPIIDPWGDHRVEFMPHCCCFESLERDMFNPTQDNWTALLWAARKGDSDVVGMLADRGADLEARDEVNRAAHAAACRWPEVQLGVVWSVSRGSRRQQGLLAPAL